MGKKQEIHIDSLIAAILERTDEYTAGSLYTLKPQEVLRIFSNMPVLNGEDLLAAHHSALETARQAQDYARAVNRAGAK